MIGIYKIENKINCKVYIGQSIAIKKRWQQHKYEARTGESQAPLYLALRKYGIENFSFEVLEECPQELLDEKEAFWIAYYKSNDRDFGYNILSGGQNGGVLYPNEWFYELWDAGFTVTEIQKELGVAHGTVRAKLEGYKDYNTHTSRSRGAAKAIKQGRIIGFNNSIETVPVYQYDLNGQYVAEHESMTGAARKLGHDAPGAESAIRAVLNHERQTAYGYQWSKEKVESMPIVSVPHGKLIRCVNTNQIFHSVREAAKWCNLKSHSGVRECCAGQRKTAGKHPQTGEKLTWEYVEN